MHYGLVNPSDLGDPPLGSRRCGKTVADAVPLEEGRLRGNQGEQECRIEARWDALCSRPRDRAFANTHCPRTLQGTRPEVREPEQSGSAKTRHGGGKFWVEARGAMGGHSHHPGWSWAAQWEDCRCFQGIRQRNRSL